MALQVKAGSFNIGTGAAGTTVEVTLGFEMKGMILWWSGRTESTDAAGSMTHLRGMGFAAGATAFRAVAGRDVDASDTANTDGGHRSDACIAEMGDGALVGWADVQSVSSTAVTFEVLDQFNTDLRVSYLALGGASLTTEIGTFSTGSSTGAQTVSTTAVGTCLFLLTCDSNASAPAVTTSSSLSFGAAQSSTVQYVWAGLADNGVTTARTQGYCRQGNILAHLTFGGAGGILNYGDFTSFNSAPNGFTLNHVARNATKVVHYLLLSGSDAAAVELGDTLMSTSAGTVTVSGLGIAPTEVLLVSACRAESAVGTSTAGDEWSLGATDGLSNRVVQQASSRNGNTLAFTHAAVQYDELYLNVDVASDTIEGSADIASFTADGFTLDMEDGDPAASFAWFVATAGPVSPAGNVTLTPTVGSQPFSSTAMSLGFAVVMPDVP